METITLLHIVHEFLKNRLSFILKINKCLNMTVSKNFDSLLGHSHGRYNLSNLGLTSRLGWEG